MLTYDVDLILYRLTYVKKLNCVCELFKSNKSKFKIQNITNLKSLKLISYLSYEQAHKKLKLRYPSQKYYTLEKCYLQF